MSIRRYLPSPQFTLLVSAIALSAGLVYAAEKYTGAQSAPGSLAAAQGAAATADDSQWQSSLDQIQAQNSSTALPPPPSQSTVAGMLQAAQSPNLTDSVGRTLLVNLTDAKAQGLGDDTPTQDKLIAAAKAQIAAQRPAIAYTSASLTTVANTAQNMKFYGNSLIQTMAAHPKANVENVFLAIGAATDNNDPAPLAALPAIAADYSALAKDLLAVPVPVTLAPLHLQIINNFTTMANAAADMEQTIADPLRGAAGLQTFNADSNEQIRVFTNIAQELSKGGILFTTGEPGYALQTLIAPN